MHIHIFVPNNYKNIGGYYIPINMYLSVIKENGINYTLYEIPVEAKEIMKFDFSSINDNFKEKINDKKILIITFTLNIAYYISKKIDLGQRSIKSISFLMDSLNYYVSSKIMIHKKLGHKVNNIIKNRTKQISYFIKERHVLKEYSDVVYVSPSDISFVKKTYKKINANLQLIPNGINLSSGIDDYFDKTKLKKKIKLGFLGSATQGNLEEIRWFVESVFPYITENDPRIELVVAGSGPEQNLFVDYFKGIDKAQYIGRFGELEEFYNRCDIVLTTIRKSCGILNKVLEAFYYKKPVIGLPENFLAFPDTQEMEHFLSFRNEKEFTDKIKYLLEGDNYSSIAEASHKYVTENYNWSTSKKKFNNILIDYFNKL